jgi:hypothetical protein
MVAFEIAFIRQTRGRRMAFGGRGPWEVCVNGSLMHLRDFACVGKGAKRRQLTFDQVNSQSGFFRFECLSWTPMTHGSWSEFGMLQPFFQMGAECGVNTASD